MVRGNIGEYTGERSSTKSRNALERRHGDRILCAGSISRHRAKGLMLTFAP